MDVEIKIDSLDDMCDNNYLDLKQDDIEVKIKSLNIEKLDQVIKTAEQIKAERK